METKSFDLLALGELLLRLTPCNNQRLGYADTFQYCIGGAELNVAAGLSMLGLRTGMLSKVPQNDLGFFVRNSLRTLGVSDHYLTYDTSGQGRLGLYYFEYGAAPRTPKVLYDRKHTSFLDFKVSDFPESVFSSTKCFHTTGITLALNPQCREGATEIIKRFKANGALISFDVNFRSNLWSGPEAKETIEAILPYVDIFFCSESTAQLTFLKEGSLKDIMRSFAEEYNISIVASTRRIVHSPKKHTFDSLIYDAKKDTFYEEAPYADIDVVDRIGSGDAYISGMLYGLLNFEGDLQKALEYGNAMGTLKNTIPGDVCLTNLSEISKIIENHKSSGTILEMER